jgi:pyridoxine 5-phosphate synthase
MGRMVVAAGAHGLTVHPRPDERHIRRSDVPALASLIANELPPGVEFNIEGYPTPDFIALIRDVRPHQVTLVPDSPEQRTSDHGWDLDADFTRLSAIMDELKASGARVSLFMDPEPVAMAQAATLGVERIELYTEPYASSFGAADGEIMLKRYVDTAKAASDAGLRLNAGHDLNLDNLPTFRQALPDLAEVSIGHAITADALRIGFPAAVEAYLRALRMPTV